MHQKITLGFMRVLRLASLLSLGLVAVRAMAQTSYVVEDLGALDGDTSSVAFAINANGDVVGWSRGQAGSRAFLYTNASGMVALPGLPDRPRTVARDINDAGQVTGYKTAALGRYHAFRWQGRPHPDDPERRAVAIHVQPEPERAEQEHHRTVRSYLRAIWRASRGVDREGRAS